jgi:NADH dehydrogenase FAD-containing subunit
MKKLVIIGTGLHHVHLLLTLTQHALEGVQVTLVAPTLRQLYSPMLADFVSGQVAPQACLIDLEPWLQNSGIRWLPLSVAALDATAQTLSLSDGSTLAYDWLSLNPTDVPDRAQFELKLPGVREHGLFLHPSEALTKLWPSAMTLAAARTLRFAVLGDSLQSIEIALALRHRLPGASITLVLESKALAHPGAAELQAHLALALKQGRITVLDDHAVRLTDGQVMLGCGAGLVCDLPLIALSAPAPGWLAASTLALNAQGHAATDAHLRSTSHAGVFSADHAEVTGQQTVWHWRATQTAADSALTQAILTTIQGLPNRGRPAWGKPLSLMAVGPVALASWGRYRLQGRYLWRLKHWLDRASVARLRKP